MTEKPSPTIEVERIKEAIQVTQMKKVIEEAIARMREPSEEMSKKEQAVARLEVILGRVQATDTRITPAAKKSVETTYGPIEGEQRVSLKWGRKFGLTREEEEMIREFNHLKPDASVKKYPPDILKCAYNTTRVIVTDATVQISFSDRGDHRPGRIFFSDAFFPIEDFAKNPTIIAVSLHQSLNHPERDVQFLRRSDGYKG